MEKLIKLNSVGSIVDIDSGMIYPMYEDGTVDFTFGISLGEEEVSSEWYEELSVKDLKVVNQIREGFKLFPITFSNYKLR